MKSSKQISLFCISTQTHDQIDSVLVGKAIFYGCWGLSITFCACELGQQLTNTLGKINDKLEQLDWYLFPTEIQRILPTVMNNIQQPIVIECFGIICASREQFGKVSDRRSAVFSGIITRKMGLFSLGDQIRVQYFQCATQHILIHSE